jgi:DHA3 family macrolide efflux protein-like MFS transporter
MVSQADRSSFRSYLAFFGGQQASMLGSSVVQFVIVWWITVETKSALYLSFAMLAGFAPMIVLVPFAGVLVDTWNRKRLIAGVDFLQALATVALIVLFSMGTASIWFVLLMLVARSVCQAFHVPAAEAIVPIMVPQDKLGRLNALSYLLTGAMNLIGPVVAAVLLSFLSIEQVLWVDPATFLVALVPLLLIKIPSIRMGIKKPSFTKDMAEGLSFIRRKRGFMPLIFMATLLNFLFMPVSTLLPYFVKFDHLGGINELALVMAVSQGGMFAGGLLMMMLKEFKRKMLATVACIAFAYLGYALLAITPMGLFWFMALGAFIMDISVAPANITLRTIIQVVVPAEMQGRVHSVLMSLASAASPFGMILAGAIVGYTGTTNLFLACAATGMIVLLASWLFTDMKHAAEKDENISPATRP